MSWVWNTSTCKVAQENVKLCIARVSISGLEYINMLSCLGGCQIAHSGSEYKRFVFWNTSTCKVAQENVKLRIARVSIRNKTGHRSNAYLLSSCGG